jgi:benzoyl-CoA reductase/2-hydroxyglutaryl-CoA dehydratase subunit BcrC/BadD/HgdB
VSLLGAANEQQRAGVIAAHMDLLLRQTREALKRAKRDGTKVVGFFPGGFVPEELIYASGAIPLCLASGGDARVADEALSLVPSVICPFARAQLGQMMLRTDPFYDAIDLLVVPSTCQHLKKIGDVCEYHEGPRVFKLGVPYEHDKDFELEYYRDRLGALKQRLEALTGNDITHDKLVEAAETYNHVRRLLRVLAQARRGTHRTEDGSERAISGIDFARLNHASLYADPVAMAASLEEICASLPSGADLPADALGGATPARPRLLLMGPNLAAGDYDLFTMVSDAGADIVVEDIFEGIRDYWQTVDLSGHQDGIEALARAYLIDKRPAAFMRGSLLPRLDFVSGLIRDFTVSGVLWYQLLCCEFFDEESYYFETALRKRGIPMLIVESDYHSLDSGQLRTRLAAFVETLVGGPIDA